MRHREGATFLEPSHTAQCTVPPEPIEGDNCHRREPPQYPARLWTFAVPTVSKAVSIRSSEKSTMSIPHTPCMGTLVAQCLKQKRLSNGIRTPAHAMPLTMIMEPNVEALLGWEMVTKPSLLVARRRSDDCGTQCSHASCIMMTFDRSAGVAPTVFPYSD
jgi:hypothetical protein